MRGSDLDFFSTFKLFYFIVLFLGHLAHFQSLTMIILSLQ